MDRRRAAGALLALAACIASSAAAPTASNQTSLDLYDETTEGCYYNFQHYGEGDRIMTNEPCLNCTCHNRMLMCYLRVCPFTKAIGQDCTVEKRADQCCPIVTCPDVPVDLLTSTSTSSPAEFGGTGVGKVDKYGCTINDKYFSEGAKVPPTPGKPCEHCYCIRNMTTCVMQECTLHVDGCTPIYHKDVCCPVRYYCDHPEDEMPLLDDMTTTVRPTPGFLLTTVAPTEPPTTTLPARRDCIEDDQLYTDGALIKTDKPCEHCYCMKGDIVCVVQECGTPMENEGKNCTSLPPREGQCCPDTYICEGDELSTEVPVTETLSEEPVTTIVPPRRASVEGSGYRNEPDEMAYTGVPTFATEMEGSGEDELTVQPEKDLADRYGTTEEAEFIPLTTQVPISEKTEIMTTEPNKGLNTVPSGIVEDESTESALQEKTTSKIPFEQQSTTPLASEEEKSSEPSLEITTPIYETKVTEPSIAEETTENIVNLEKESVSPLEKETTPDENKQSESSLSREPEKYTTVKPEDNILSTKEPTVTETATGIELLTESVPGGDETHETSDASVTPTTLSDEIKTTGLPLVKEKDDIQPSDNEKITTVSPSTEVEGEVLPPDDERKTTVSSPTEEGEMLTSVDQTKTTVLPLIEESETFAPDSRRTTLDLGIGTTPKVEDKTEAPVSEHTTPVDKFDTTEHEQNTVPIGAEEDQSTEAPSKMTTHEESKVTELLSTTEREDIPVKPLEKESSEQPSFEITTTTSKSIIDNAEILSTTVTSQGEVPDITTEPIFKKDEVITSTESDINKELSTMGTVEVAKETEEPSDKEISTEKATINEQEAEVKITTLKVPEKQEEQEATTESIMELSTFAHVTEKDLASTLQPENLATTTSTAPDKIDTPQSTTINPAENEIAEVPSPGRIPGEGDCLLEGTTYQNDSIVPSTNKCHSGCKCVSSIIKCDPIICSSPPEDMDNCQPRYDTPEACCPTYVCDHGMQTIPPQSQSHITGTESPAPSTIECHGADCDKHDEKPLEKPSQIPEQVASDCGSSGCDQTIQSPSQPCTGDQCEVLQPPKEQEKPQEIPSTDSSQSCTNPEDCKEIKIPVTCEGKSCADSQDSPCDKEGGCLINSEEMPIQETPQVCTTEEECKQVKIPQPESVPCEGESCLSVQEDCSTGECKTINISPQPSQQGEGCSKENGCSKPHQAVECEGEKCVQKEVDTTEIVCSGDICTQQQPTSSTEETAHTVSTATISPPSEQVTSRQPILEEKTETSSPGLPTTLSEEEITVEPTVTSEPNKETKEPESPVSDEEDRVTKSPDEIVSSYIPEKTDIEQAVTETSSEAGITSNEPATEIPQEHSTVAVKIDETAIPVSSPTEESPQDELDVKPTKEKTERPEEITESYNVSTEKPDEFIEKETEVPKEQYDDTKHTDLPGLSPLEESTKEPEIADREQEPSIVSPEPSVTEAVNVEETVKPQEEPEKSSTGIPEMVTVSLSEETTKLSETSESSITVTEPSIQESYEHPEMSTSSGAIVTKMEISTPALMAAESTTPSYEKEFISTIHVTEQQEDITKVPKEDTEKRTTIPLVSDTTEAVILADTKLPETEEKYTTTEIPMKPTELDEHVPTEQISVEEMPDKHLIPPETPEQSEIATPVPHIDSDQTNAVDIDIKEKVTTIPEKETESPLSHVTELSPDSTSMITESNEMPELSSAAPSQEQESMSTAAPESDVTDEAARPSGTENTEAPQQATTEQKLPTESVTEQEVMTEMPLSAVTEPTKPSVIDQQPSLPTSDSEVLVSQEPVTKASVEETPEVLEKTTSLPLEPATSGEKVEEVTEPREPTIFEEPDFSTDAPEIPEKEVHDSATTDVNQEILTKEPELYVTVASHIDKPTESLEKEQTTEKPTLVVKEEQTVAPDTTENVPVIITESQELPTQVPEKISTQIPVSDEEKTETPEEFITKQTSTELPKTTVETEIMHHEPTIIPQLVDTEPQKSSTEKSADIDSTTIIPELESTEQHEIEKEDMPITSGPEQPMEETQTKLPEVQTTSNAQPEPASPETTIIPPKIEEIEHEDKQTEQPVSLVTEPIYTTAEPKLETTTRQEQDIGHKKEEEPTESTSEKISETTELPVEISTIIPVSEEDKPPKEPVQTSRPEVEHSETTPYLVELEEHTHKMDDEELTIIPSDEPTVASSEEPSITSSEPSISTLEEATNAPSLETTIIASEEPAIAPSEKPTGILSEHSTVTPMGELTVVPSKEPTVVQSEESTVATIAESTVSLLGEPTVSVSEEQTVAPSEEPNVALSEGPSTAISEESTTSKTEMHTTEQEVIEKVTEKLAIEENQTELPEDITERPSDHKQTVPLDNEEPHTTVALEEMPEKSTESIVDIETTSEIVKPTDELLDKYGSPEDSEKEAAPTTLKPVVEDVVTTSIPSSETEIPASVGETEKVVTAKPQFVPAETTAPEEEFIPVTTKVTTSKPEEEAPTEIEHSKPEDKPSEPASTTAMPEISKPDEMQPVDEVPSPEDESHFPPSGGYNQEPDYVEEDQAFGPGTCRYGGKVYVSAQQIPRDDPCDFCFCFRSDIICLQQSCPPPIHGCHEEPIQGFCCPRYECPVSMATSLNVTTTTTTTTTTLPPHFLPHAYKGAATRKGCQIKGHTYQVGDVVRASSGPCLHCTCGGDGQMKCDPKQCTPEPMLRQMIAAAVSAKRRR